MLDPYEKQSQYTSFLYVPTEITKPDRTHSTILVFYCNQLSSYSERMTRLASSFNLNDTIKADIITVGDQKIYRGLYLGDERSVEPEDFQSIWLDHYRLIVKAESPLAF